jgi:hypothetical protein
MQARLGIDTVKIASGYDAICLFVNDLCDAEVRATMLLFYYGGRAPPASCISLRPSIASPLSPASRQDLKISQGGHALAMSAWCT